ncbi:hypothetical protein N7462_000362 [Penicillium macrosclerotiorum]|uniref:uncharacterized protein n=1 Tax=Penicillium macrosclerotiorum TaxID=303699 RepID=UPI0025496F57|nr:uncharacterized protein N7462_000362 [Penicillium macrosclerotiorum]KAJ5698357.1 hypothetical protein N7462_000362 [Penicillium macrosclerotiorum]
MALHKKPIFVFVPGAWHTADTFDGIRDLLTARGFESEAVTIPSVGSNDPKTGLYADTGYTRGIIHELVSNGRQVVVVNHSYGGLVGAGAVEGLGYAQRAKTGQPGGVIMVVWMAAVVAPKGKSVIDMLGGNWLPWMLLKSPDDGYCYSSEQEHVFYHDMTPEEQQKAISKLKPHPVSSLLEPVLYEPWHDMPSFFLYFDKDQALPLQVQESFAQTLGNPAAFHTDGSHSAFLSMPEQVAGGLELALKTGQEQSGIIVN